MLIHCPFGPSKPFRWSNLDKSEASQCVRSILTLDLDARFEGQARLLGVLGALAPLCSPLPFYSVPSASAIMVIEYYTHVHSV